jgi:hypothetical protein
MTGIAILFLGACIVWIFAANASQSKKVELSLTSIASKLESGAFDLKKRIAYGAIGGANVWFRYVVRGSGKHAQHWTEIEAEVPPQYPLRMFIRKHGWLDQGKIDRGDMVDVIVGDAAFDNHFLVEAAPAAVARILLDARERTYLLELSQRLWLEVTSERGEVAGIKLSVRTWVMDLPDATRAIEAMVAISGRLRDAYAAVDRATEVKDVGTPYRPMLDDTAAKEAADARLAEVEQVDKVRTQRAAGEHLIAVVIIFLFVVVALVAIATSGNH